VSTVTELRELLALLPDLTIRFATTPEELAAIVEVRRRVFQVEQGIVDHDLTDSDERQSFQAMALVPDGVVSVGRLSPPHRFRQQAQIAWVATLQAFRGHGVGTALMRALLEKADAERYSSVVLSAQTHALHFYARLGFIPYGQRFMVRSIEHQMMSRRLPE
jgi:predicted GNAT family N-acyltransferase